jgi:maleylacetate reductase
MADGVQGFIHEQLAQRIVFGWGRLEELPAEIDRIGGTHVLVIAERSTTAIAARIEGLLADRLVTSLGPVRPHVPTEDAAQARRLAEDNNVDLVLTVGGGTATGLGKAVAITGVPLVTVPTTYAGSEATPIHGTTENSRKRTGRDARALPRTVLYDPSLTTTLPARATATTGMNALAHCVEALYAENRTPVTSLLAFEAIEVLSRALPMCVKDSSSRSGRTDALYGAYLAGTVLAVTGMAIHHRICHVLGGTLGLAHGDSNSVLLPHAAAFNEVAAPEEMSRIAEILESENAAVGLFDLAESMDAPTSLEELGVEEQQLEQVADLVLEGNHYNPRPVTKTELLELLRNAYEGRRPAG